MEDDPEKGIELMIYLKEMAESNLESVQNRDISVLQKVCRESESLINLQKAVSEGNGDLKNANEDGKQINQIFDILRR